MAFFCKGKGLCQEVSGRSASSKDKKSADEEKEKNNKKTNEKMKVANLQKQWLEPLDLFGKTDLPEETQTKKMTHISGAKKTHKHKQFEAYRLDKGSGHCLCVGFEMCMWSDECIVWADLCAQCSR